MRLSVALALLVSVFSLRVGAVTQIVAIGDSLTDDCNHGAKQVVDAALDSTAVSTALAPLGRSETACSFVLSVLSMLLLCRTTLPSHTTKAASSAVGQLMLLLLLDSSMSL